RKAHEATPALGIHDPYVQKPRAGCACEAVDLNPIAARLEDPVEIAAGRGISDIARAVDLDAGAARALAEVEERRIAGATHVEDDALSLVQVEAEHLLGRAVRMAGTVVATGRVIGGGV